MAANVGTAYITIAPQMGNLTGAVESAVSKANLSGAGASIGSKLSGGFLKGGAVAGAAASLVSKGIDSITSSLGSAINRVDTLNNFPKVMQSLGYSADAASDSIKTISEHLDGLPSSTDALASLTQRIAATGGSLEDATATALAFNDVMLAGGASTQATEAAMTQFTQILSKGKAQGEDWNSIMQTAPGQMKQLAEAMLGAGATAHDLGEYLGVGVSGSIPTERIEEFKQALITLDSEGSGSMQSFAEQASSASAGIGTAMDNVGNRVSKAVAKVIDAVGQSNISGAINAFSDSFDGVATTVAAFVTSMKDNIDFEGVTASFKPFVDTVSGAGQPINDLANALGNLVGVVTGEALQGIGLGLSTIAQNASTLAPVAMAFAAVAIPLEVLAAIGTAGSIGALASQLLKLPTIIGGITTVMGALEGAMATLSLLWAANPLGVVLIAIGAVAAALTTLYLTNEDFRNLVNEIFGNVVAFFQNTVGPVIVDVFNTVVAGIQGAIEFIATVPGSICGFFSGIGDTLGGFFSGIPGKVSSVFNSVVSFVTGIPSRIVSVFSGIGSKIGGFFSNVKSVITKPFNDAWNTLKSIPSRITGIFSKMKIEIPHFKIPHINVDGGSAPWGIGGQGRAPSFSVDWYAKGGFFDSPSIIGVGDDHTGGEYVLNQRHIVQIADKMAARQQQSGGNSVVVNLNYSADADANQMVRDIASGLRRLQMTGA